MPLSGKVTKSSPASYRQNLPPLFSYPRPTIILLLVFRKSRGAEYEENWAITFEQFLASILTEPPLVQFFSKENSIQVWFGFFYRRGLHSSCEERIRIFGSSEEDEVSGFFVLSHLWMRGYFRLS